MSDKKTSNILSNDFDNVKVSLRKTHLIGLLDKAKSLPKQSGCYFMKNKANEIIYVGKAVDLKARVSSYFNGSQKSPKTLILVGHIVDFDFIISTSDAESLVLENNLIKEHRPKYNIRLKDDKSYPYLKINYNDQFPKLEYVRRPKRSKHVEFFGPFPVGSNISKILKILTKAFSLRDCSQHEFNSRKTACILEQMGQCSAPCVSMIGRDEYRKDLETAIDFFRGKIKSNKSLEELTNLMMSDAENERFEQAALKRDYLEELDIFKQKSFEQSVEWNDESNVDIISYYVGSEEIDISIYLIRHGNLLGHKNFHFLNADIFNEVADEVQLAMLQYYINGEDIIPEKIVTSFGTVAAKNFEQALLPSMNEGAKLKVSGKSKKYASILGSAYKHAEESQRVRIENQESVFVGLNKLKSLLNLKDRPKTLECYDIAIWQGKSPAASQIVFYEGKPEKNRYRYYHLNERPEGNNDFAMMAETFRRRLKRGELPDVFVVDGGIQQVNTVKKVLVELEIDRPVIGIAKARDLTTKGFRSSDFKNSEERLIIQGRSNPFILNKCPSLMRIIVQMRDEAHRFSRKLHHKAEHKRVITTWVSEVKGLNDNVRNEILRVNTLSRDELSEMNINQLEKFLGIGSKHARILFDFLHADI